MQKMVTLRPVLRPVWGTQKWGVRWPLEIEPNEEGVNDDLNCYFVLSYRPCYVTLWGVSSTVSALRNYMFDYCLWFSPKIPLHIHLYFTQLLDIWKGDVLNLPKRKILVLGEAKNCRSQITYLRTPESVQNYHVSIGQTHSQPQATILRCAQAPDPISPWL